MAGIYEIRRYGKAVLLITAAAMVALFLYISNGLVHDLSMQERDRMEIWADATKQIINIGASDEPGAVDLDFLLGIIERNTTIPVLLTDDDGNILQYRNLDLPEPVADNMAAEMSETNRKFLQDKLAELSSTPRRRCSISTMRTRRYSSDSAIIPMCSCS